MKLFVREQVMPLLALTCAAAVFLFAALDLPDDARAAPAPARTAR
jgi:hypothetical protein